jgi:hypothetical protein
MTKQVLRSYAAGFLAALICALGVQAQTAPPTSGTILTGSVVLYNDGSQYPLGTCPTDFWSPAPPSTAPVCYQATMTCANASTPNIIFVYSYVQQTATPLGTIVLFSGTGGEPGGLAVNNKFAQDYYSQNYEVVEVAWQTEWEQTASAPLGILTAACRPAGFLNYVLNTPLLNARSPTNSRAGLCAQGLSAGSGALAYSLVSYQDGNGNNLSTDYDNVELESGPVFGDIGMGCQMGAAGSNPLVAPICYSGQYGCSPGTTAWGNGANYVADNLNSIQAWTGSLTPACRTPNNSASVPAWKAMSVVTGSGGNFTYPTLGMAGWLCASSQQLSGGGCGYGCPNNSAAEGEQFYSQITSSSQAAGYKVTGILSCEGAEGVAEGTDPDPYPPGCTPGVNCTTQQGITAIEEHMQQQCKHPTPNQ